MKRAGMRPFGAVAAPKRQLLHRCLERWQAMSAPDCSGVVPLAVAVCPACADSKAALQQQSGCIMCHACV